jgi:hypothetical protein
MTEYMFCYELSTGTGATTHGAGIILGMIGVEVILTLDKQAISPGQ